jgi:hypothetical protein
VLAATVAELLEFQPFRRRLPVLGGRIIPLFAITALQRNNLSGHISLPVFVAPASRQHSVKLSPFARRFLSREGPMQLAAVTPLSPTAES